MAVETIPDMTELTSPATDDQIPIWDYSAQTQKWISKANFMGGSLTGGGTVATGGFTLTVPATGTAALLGTANVFTAAQTIQHDPGTSIWDGLVLTSGSIADFGSPDNGKGLAIRFKMSSNTNAPQEVGGIGVVRNGVGDWSTDMFFRVKKSDASLVEALRLSATGHVFIGTTTDAAQLTVNGATALVDGMTAPSTTSGWAKIYVDSADGDLKVKFGDGTVKTLATDT